MRLGPSTCIPADMLRPDVLLCLGEEKEEFDRALDLAGFMRASQTHRHRTFTAELRGDVLCVDGGLSSAIVETSLWELLRPGVVRRIVLVGTAGTLPGFTGDAGVPYLLDPTESVYQAFDAPQGASWSPTLQPDLPTALCISSDRFYGFSSRTEQDYPAEPGLSEAWARHRDRDGLVDMEAAAFYHHCEAFAGGDLQYAAIKTPANPVTDLDALPEASAEAVERAVVAARPLF